MIAAALLNNDPIIIQVAILGGSILIGCIGVGLGLEMVAEWFAPRPRRRIR